MQQSLFRFLPVFIFLLLHLGPALPTDECSEGEKLCEFTGVCYKPWEEECQVLCSTSQDCRLTSVECGPLGCDTCLVLLADDDGSDLNNGCSPLTDPSTCECSQDCVENPCQNQTAYCGLLTSDVGLCQVEQADENGCAINRGEVWCETLQICHAPWRVQCPSSCLTDQDCKTVTALCSVFACECLAVGIDQEDNPCDCPPEGTCTQCVPDGLDNDPCLGRNAICSGDGLCIFEEPTSTEPSAPLSSTPPLETSSLPSLTTSAKPTFSPSVEPTSSPVTEAPSEMPSSAPSPDSAATDSTYHVANWICLLFLVEFGVWTL